MPRKGREGMGVKNFLVFCHYEQIKCICRTVQTILPYYTWSLCDLFMNFVALIFVFCPGFILNLFLISTGYSVQFSSVTQSCPTLCNPMNCSMPGLPVHHQLPESTQTHVHWVGWCHPTISSSVIPFSSCPESLPASESFPVSQLFE